MNRHLTTIPATRDRGPVRVERKIRRRTAEEVRGLGVTAVGDGLFRMGGPLSGRDMLRILTTPQGVRSGNGQNGPVPAGKPSAIKEPEEDPVLPKSGPDMRGIMHGGSGALADDVCRHIWTERGRFAPILYGST